MKMLETKVKFVIKDIEYLSHEHTWSDGTKFITDREISKYTLNIDKGTIKYRILSWLVNHEVKRLAKIAGEKDFKNFKWFLAKHNN